MEDEPTVPDQTGTVDGKKTKTIYDDLGRVTYSIESFVDFDESDESDTTGGDGSDDRVVKTEYDGLDNVIRLTALDQDASGSGTDDEITRYFYEDPNDAALQTNIIYPDSSDTTSSGTDQVKLTYYRDGRLDERTDQRDVKIRHEYIAYGEGRRLENETVIGTLPS